MASSKIKGITIEIGGETTKLGQALESAEKSSKSLQTELKGVNSLLKLDPSNVDLLRQKQDLLTQSIDATKDKLSTLKTTMAQIKSGEIQVSEEEFRDLQREIVSTEQKLDNLKKQSKDFGSVFQQQVEVASKKVKELGGKVEDAGKKMSGLSVGAAAGLGAAITAAAGLEDATNKYLGSTGKAIDETEKYQDILKSIHDNNYGEDYADIADKMRIVSNILGDLPTDQLQSVVEKSYMLEDAYGMDFQENVRGVNSLMDQFGITAEQAYELINQGAQKGLNQNQDLTDQIAEYSTYYSKLGFTAEEFFNIMIAGSKDGAYQIDYLNDAMKEFGIRTKDNSSGTIGALEQMGLNAQDIMNKFAQGGDTAQEAFAAVTSSLMALEDPVKRNELGVQLFGTKWEDLEENAVNAMTTAKSEVDMLGTTVEQTSETMYGGTANKAQASLRTIKTAFADLGAVILPILTPIAEKISELAKKFGELNPTIQKIIVIVLGLVAALAPVLIIVGKVIQAVGVIMPIIVKIGGILMKAVPILKGIGAVIGTVVGAIGIVPIIIAGVIAAIVLLWTKCEWFRDLIKGLWEGIKAGLEVAFEFIKGIFNGIVQFFSLVWEGIKAVFGVAIEWFKSIFEAIGIVIKTIWDGIVLYFQLVWEGIKLVFSVMVDWFKMIFQAAVDAIKLVFGSIINFFKTVWETIKGIFSVVKDVFTGNFKGAWEGIKGIVGKWGEFFQGVWDGIKKIFGGVADWFKNIFTKAWEGVKNVFSTGGKIFDGIKDGIANVFKTVVNGIIGGINKVIAVPFNAINGMLNGIRNASFLGISPFKGMWKQNPLSVPQIPKLAKGNVAYGPTLAEFGEYANARSNPEITAPQSIMRDTMMDALTEFTNIRAQGNSEIKTLTNLMNKYMPEIVSNMGQNIVLDDNTLVGKITPKIDHSLGDLTARRRRGY